VSILIVSSVWISYFRGTIGSGTVDFLIAENLVVTNELILAELTPPLHVRRQRRLIALLQEIKRYSIEIDWEGITKMQITCIRKGINGIGIPDLIIAQNAVQNSLHLLSLDKHFRLLSKHLPLSLYS